MRYEIQILNSTCCRFSFRTYSRIPTRWERTLKIRHPSSALFDMEAHHGIQPKQAMGDFTSCSGSVRISDDVVRKWGEREKHEQLFVGRDCLQDYRTCHLAGG